MQVGRLKPLPHDLDVPSRGSEAPLGLLLESVQDVNRLGKAHGVDGRKVSVSNRDTTSRMPGPMPASGFASRCFNPICAWYRA